MSDTLHRITDWLTTAALGFVLGIVVGGYFPPVAPPQRPIPAPAPAPVPVPVPPQPAPVHHSGHFTVSYIEPRYGSPTSASVRDQLAGTDWKPLDATFRSYVDGQEELKTLGFTRVYKPADLPVLFIQESQGAKGAPIIDTVKGPASAAAVLTRVKELRGL